MNDKEGNRSVARLDKAMDRLGCHVSTDNLASALRATRLTLETSPWLAIVGSTATVVAVARVMDGLLLSLSEVVAAIGAHPLADSMEKYGLHIRHMDDASSPYAMGPGTERTRLIMAFGMVVGLCGLAALLLLLRSSTLYRYMLTISIVNVLESCASLKQRSYRDRVSALRDVDRGCRGLERQILVAHRRVGGITRRSSRRVPAVHHAYLVAGALRVQLARIDIEPDEAVDELASMLVQIGERHALGQVGQLLPVEVLSGVTPVSRSRTAIRESLHAVAVIATALSAALVVNSLVPKSAVSEDLRPWLLAGSAVAAAILIGGWQRVVRLLEVLPGK
ncbi:hypothetical protein [Streptomyces phaeochromogenes]|uniref:hypothetical protein n=1 Tax=Streptomyces phaeochromogenes TaxID=1923 RepID=UPI003723BBB6